MPDTLTQSIDEISGHCFGCGPDNPAGLHLHFHIDPLAHTATTTVSLDARYQGAPATSTAASSPPSSMRP